MALFDDSPISGPPESNPVSFHLLTPPSKRTDSTVSQESEILRHLDALTDRVSLKLDEHFARLELLLKPTSEVDLGGRPHPGMFVAARSQGALPSISWTANSETASRAMVRISNATPQTPTKDAFSTYSSEDSNLQAMRRLGSTRGSGLVATNQLYDVSSGYEAFAVTELASEVANRSIEVLQQSEHSGLANVGKSAATPGKRNKWWVLSPSSPKRLMWDSAGMLFIAYDLVTIPLTVFFGLPESVATQIMFWMGVIFWTLDMGLACVTGYYSKGDEEMDPRRIVAHYLKTWWPFDMLILGSDWLTWVTEEGRAPALARFGKSVRALRIIRSFRLLRLVKIQKVVERCAEYIESEYLLVLIGILKGTLFVLLMNHILACIWYGIGNSLPQGGQSWVLKAGWDEEEDLGYRYLTSLHWSLTQFTPAGMEVVPTNSLERIYAVFVLVFAFIVFSSFLSNITASVNELRQLSLKHDKNMALLRKYLRFNRISSNLGLRIVKYVEYRESTKKQEVRHADVSFLSMLSTQLHMELVQETYQPTITHAPFFHRLASDNHETMRELCNTATHRVPYSVGDTIFSRGQHAKGTIFVLSGAATYKRRDLQAMVQGAPFTEAVHPVKAGGYASEAALWTNWVHVGHMHAKQNSECILLYPEKVLEVMKKHPRSYVASVCYGYRFVSWLNREAERGALSDLPSTRREWQDVVLTPAFVPDFSGHPCEGPGTPFSRSWRLLWGDVESAVPESQRRRRLAKTMFTTILGGVTSPEAKDDMNWGSSLSSAKDDTVSTTPIAERSLAKMGLDQV